MAISMRELSAMFPTSTVREMGRSVRQLRSRRRAVRAGIGYEVTPGAGYEDQYQQIEESRGYTGPLQSMAATKAGAPALYYRLPATESAFLARTMRLPGGVTQGQVYSGDVRGGVPTGVHPLLAALYPQLQLQPTPWKNPWSAEQFFGGTPTGMPVWGGGVLQAFQQIQGVGPARMAAQVPGQGYPEPGSAIERF
jgi:hypothetical protein